MKTILCLLLWSGFALAQDIHSQRAKIYQDIALARAGVLGSSNSSFSSNGGSPLGYSVRSSVTGRNYYFNNKSDRIVEVTDDSGSKIYFAVATDHHGNWQCYHSTEDGKIFGSSYNHVDSSLCFSKYAIFKDKHGEYQCYKAFKQGTTLYRLGGVYAIVDDKNCHSKYAIFENSHGNYHCYKAHKKGDKLYRLGRQTNYVDDKHCFSKYAVFENSHGENRCYKAHKKDNSLYRLGDQTDYVEEELCY